MRYINLLILTLFFSMIPIYANEIVVDGCTVYFSNLTNKQKDEIIGLRENLLIKSNDIKNYKNQNTRRDEKRESRLGLYG